MTSTTKTAPSTPIPGMPNPDALKKELSKPKPEDDPRKDPKSRDTYVFEIDMAFSDGERFKGSFTNKILTIEDKANVSLLMNRLANGIAFDLLDGEGQYLISVIAHLTYSLTEKPKWFDVTTMKHTPLINAVFKEVTAHEEFFRRPLPVAFAGKE